MEQKDDLKNLLYHSAQQFNIELGNDTIEAFLSYMSLLKEWNQKINLTAIEDDTEIIIKHFIDSLSIIHYIEPGSSLIDIGTGAGFPGIPAKLVIKDIRLTLLDSLDKRVKFLNELTEMLMLKDVKTVHGRAEDFGMNHGYREAFKHATARAVAGLPVLLEYCLPFVQPGGTFIAMKGNAGEEIEKSKNALLILGGEIEKVEEVKLPSSDAVRNIIIIRKLRQTPTKYPRKAGKPSKEPL
jgi:16S rRNA (guanine527-N7)-methyltransferase